MRQIVRYVSEPYSWLNSERKPLKRLHSLRDHTIPQQRPQERNRPECLLLPGIMALKVNKLSYVALCGGSSGIFPYPDHFRSAHWLGQDFHLWQAFSTGSWPPSRCGSTSLRQGILIFELRNTNPRRMKRLIRIV
jgi:hypothetical protein